ncbi:MAG: hypothetical protein KKB85_00975, partial [Candidatus Altiarchaeota archaeon]|nr:hypothetical protein [Candidatus Altiarchaeota archaeon]
LLHDQSKFAGIGNIYANDSLFLAKIHHQTPARNISPKAPGVDKAPSKRHGG